MGFRIGLWILVRPNALARDLVALPVYYRAGKVFRQVQASLLCDRSFHQLQKRIEAHILIAFLAFCLYATLRHKLRLRAP